MRKQIIQVVYATVPLALLLGLGAVPATPHHSFAMYDQSTVVTVTGAMRQFVPQANHAELHFLLIADDRKGFANGKDGKPQEWGVEMNGTAALAQQGITPESFKAGTVFSVKLNPLRDGSNFGSRVGAVAQCPMDTVTKKPKLPAAGKHCDSVEGRTLFGGNSF
jgi:hypothetical protein